MMILAIIGATALQDFEEAAAVAFLFSISEWLETKATSRARTALSAIVSLRPDFAYLIDDSRDAIVRVPASALFVGAKVSVRQGDKIPCDGIIVQGASSVDESSITGESRPIRKTTGDQVSGGTINCGLTQIVVSVTATVDDSAVSKLIRLVEDAQMNRSPTEMMVDAFAKCYTPFVVLLSLCMITIPWAWGKAVGRTWMRHGLITIVLACPCALVISTPVTYVAALAATAQKGILVKGGAFLEALGRVRKVCMDKTGTLTEGIFSLDFFEPIGDRFTRIQVLEYLACVEAHASHPIASALVAAAESEGVDVRKAAIMSQQSTNIEGLGVSAVVNGLTIHAGNVELFKRLGIYSDLPAALLQSAERWKLNGGSLGFISVSGHGIVGAYSVSDKVRSEAKSVVTALFESGITVCMLTGDNHTAAHSIGQQVGIDSDCIKSQLLPQEKLDFIRKMKEDEPSNSSKQSFFSFLNCFRRRLCRIQRGLVLMIGDGVNDGPALAAADVGVSMGKGAALAIETSDITLMDSNLEKLLYSLKMGWRVRMVILQNIIFSIVTKTIVVVLVFVGYGSLWLAICKFIYLIFAILSGQTHSNISSY
jgi:Cd2+/Zn2+-exporting ATPase